MPAAWLSRLEDLPAAGRPGEGGGGPVPMLQLATRSVRLAAVPVLLAGPGFKTLIMRWNGTAWKLS